MYTKDLIKGTYNVHKFQRHWQGNVHARQRTLTRTLTVRKQKIQMCYYGKYYGVYYTYVPTVKD